MATLYLRETHPDALTERFEHLIQNLWSTDRHGKVQAARDPRHRREIRHLLFHVLLEQARRGGAPAASEFDEPALIGRATAHYAPPRLSSSISGGPGGFAKYGKRDHLRAAFERGVFRIAPASSYDDPSLNPAQADRELQHFAVTANERLPFKLYSRDKDGKEVEAAVKPLELFRYMNVGDFYVWCCGWGCDLRMLHDFGADALLLVRDQAAFVERMLRAVEAVRPGAIPVHGPVAYYDPYTVAAEQLRPVFVKNLKYLYQNEYRFAWSIPAGSSAAPFLVELGPLDDIAEYYESV